MGVHRSSRLHRALVLMLLAAAAGCSGSRLPVDPARPGAGHADRAHRAVEAVGRTDLDLLWPNEDGRRWDYRYVGRAASIGYLPHPNIADVPPAPPIEYIAQLLGRARGRNATPPLPPGTLPPLTEPFALQFNGEITTASGVTAQNLEEHFGEASPGFANGARDPWEARLLSRLTQVRPDLRGRLEAMGVGAVSGPYRPPIFLHGYAWEKTAQHIGTYGDVDQSLAWKFLDADVSPGSGFVFRLVPSLAPDVFLHAMVVPRNQQRHVKEYVREQQVVYLIDYGILAESDPRGGKNYVRFIDYGSVVYVPGVGPVETIECFGATSDSPTFVGATNDITLLRVTPGSGGAGVAAMP